MFVIDPAVYSRALHFAVDTIEQAISKHGKSCTFEHIMAELAEAATRQLPAGTHYLRNAVDEADKANAALKAERREYIEQSLRGVAWLAIRSPEQGNCIGCKRLTTVYKAYNGGQVLPVKACADCADIVGIPIC